MSFYLLDDTTINKKTIKLLIMVQKLTSLTTAVFLNSFHPIPCVSRLLGSCWFLTVVLYALMCKPRIYIIIYIPEVVFKI